MNYRAFMIAILLLVVPAITGAQKLEIVESDLLPLDTAKAVSLEFYYRGITINEYPNEGLFLRANRGNEAVTKAYLSARDSLNAKAFLQGYSSVADSTVPELQNDNKEVAMHLIVKTVHWQTTPDNSEPDYVVLEYILMANPGRRLQHGRYYMRKVLGQSSEDRVKNMSSAYFSAGQAFARAIQNYQPEE